MDDEYILKHLQDVPDTINEMQSCFVGFSYKYRGARFESAVLHYHKTASY